MGMGLVLSRGAAEHSAASCRHIYVSDLHYKENYSLNIESGLFSKVNCFQNFGRDFAFK